MKQRISSLDLRALAHELHHQIVSLRLQNIYDLGNSRSFIFKFARPGLKHVLLVESGFRLHLTDFVRDKSAAPSAFCAKLRKHIRTRRLTGLSQIGTDRALKLTFGGYDDPLRNYNVILEFYAKGNIVLTNGNMTILGILRLVTVEEEGEQQRYAVGEKYKLAERQEFQPMTRERLLDLVAKRLCETVDEEVANPLQRTKKKRSKAKNTLANILGVHASEYGAALVEHVILKSGINPNASLADVDWNADSPEISALLSSFKEAEQIINTCSQPCLTGFIIAKKENRDPAKNESSGSTQEILLYEEFHPFLPIQFADRSDISIIKFEQGFSHTTDVFFSTLEAQKLESRLRQAHLTAEKRLQSAREEHSQRVQSLKLVQEVNIGKARAIEANLNRVDEAAAAVSGLVAQGMDWMAIETLIKLEKTNSNPVAEIICLPLKLAQNSITLALTFGDDDDEESDSGIDETESEASDSESGYEIRIREVLKVDIDLSISAWANARNYYGKKRQAAAKQEKTVQSSSKALKSTEKKIAADLKKSLAQEKQLMHPIRKTQWFEKFYWFISSEGYLVLGGRDAQQNELLYKRYFRKGDIYVHADLQGASSVIIKNTSQTAPIPPGTLSQAGLFSVATSKAWDAKILTSAWWVHHEQVSKTAPTGEYITTGSFMIRGKKNFLAPAPLVMGFGILWVLDEASRDRHLKRRLEREQRTEEREKDSVASHINDKEYSSIQQSANIDPQSQKTTDASLELSSVLPTDDNERNGMTANDKYDLADYGDEISLPSFLQPVQPSTSGKPHISARQRRDMSKAQIQGVLPSSPLDSGISTPISEADPDGIPVALTPEELDRSGAGLSNGPTRKEHRKPQVRGKKGQQKKAQKYADQDEEERQLRMQLLGVARQTQTSVPQENPTFKKKPKIDREAKQLLKEENIQVLNEEEEANLTLLDNFTGFPLPDDVLLGAIPLCGPYAAMGKYKYKVKLIPGSMKKGKAVKALLSHFASMTIGQDSETASLTELELVKTIKDAEMCVGIGKMKVMTGKSDSSKGKAKGKGRR
ncbi:Nuclear export mediator factor Nemf [Neolecta irregularis DAH-3]|uniref:Ribosome quality control complex subunit 2 n=1 Tax=Neolecta irregularis (strain DAH-3) TaxID=1198029 RepID=A0A1U7LR15_NEOID|nr:Nuclear export mediator factor Nemf [Neolecta irregularis DAH-3]|eukprot:OLL25084.1 Nuclear export mediator factor Nemf [Neolecta irregularis DAH-3]